MNAYTMHDCETCGIELEFECDGPVYAFDRPSSWPVTGFDCECCTDRTCYACGDKESKTCNSCIEWQKTALCSVCGERNVEKLYEKSAGIMLCVKDCGASNAA